MPQLALYLLGTPHLELDGVSLAVNRRKVFALLAYMALNQRPHRRDHVATLFWPDYDLSTARGNLRRALSTLNRTVSGSCLQIDREQVSVRRDDSFWLDVDQFHSYLISCTYHGHAGSEVCTECLHPLGQAVAVYRDDFLTGFTLPDSPEFDDWQLLQTESLRRELTDALEKLIRGLARNRQFTPAIAYARRWLTLDPLQESAHRQLMRLLSLSGERNAALTQYESCRQILFDELGLEPTAATISLYEQIRSGVLTTQEQGGTGLAFHASSGSSHPAAGPRNLPDPVTPFIGRASEVNEIVHLVCGEPACRLLTLVGPGGVGKTRLALEAATQAVESFPDGVHFVPLAPVFAAESLIRAISEALNHPLSSSKPTAELLNYLSRKEMLLLLDNFEQLIPAGGTDLLLDICMAAPGVKLLVTSRERLSVQLEWAVEVSGLHVPQFASFQDQDWPQVEAYDAVQLFLQRARHSRHSFTLSDANRPEVIRICQMVEGMPLGIELAAAWLRMMSCQEIAGEIERGLDFLATSLRDVPERHRSLRAVFAQSWGLLSEEERAAFRKLSVFRGGFRRMAAERVANASLPVLSTLVDKSLLRRSRVGRYEIHELLRQYASEKLDEIAGERDRTQDRHSLYFLTFVEQRTDDLKGRRQKEALADIAADIDNVRAAWRWAVVRRNTKALGKSAEGLVHFSNSRGWLQEGAAAFQQAVQSLSVDRTGAGGIGIAESENIVLGQLMAGEGWFRGRQGRLARGQERLQQGVSLLRQAQPGSRPELAFSLRLLADICFFRGQYGQTKQVAQQLLDTSRELDDFWGAGTALWFLGAASIYQGEYLEATQFVGESARILRQLGEPRGLVDTALLLGIASRMRGEYEEASRALEDILPLSREFALMSGYILRELGYLAIALGGYRQAQRRMQESLTLFTELGSRTSSVFPLDGLGSVARLMGEYEQSQRLHEQSLAISREVGENRGIAFTLNNLGRLAYDKKEFSEAEQLQQQSFEAFEQLGHKQGIATALCHLGYAISASARHRHAEAGQYFRQALKLAMEIGAAPVALDALAGYAQLQATGQASKFGREQAIALLSLVQRHPASEQETKDKTQRVMSILASSLTPEVMAKTQDRNQAKTLDAVVMEVLDHNELDHEGGARPRKENTG